MRPTCALRDEQQVRVDLAAVFRLAALAGWDDTVYTEISASVPGEPGVYRINSFGLGFDEVPASSLVKVDVLGQVVDGSKRPVNPSGFAIHGAVHAARPEAECVIICMHPDRGLFGAEAFVLYAPAGERSAIRVARDG